MGGKGTRAISIAEKAGIRYTVHEYGHDPAAPSYGLEAATALGLAPGRVFKTLIAQVDQTRLVVALVPVDRQLNLKALASAVGAKKAAIAPAAEAERATGYVVGGISPLGQKKRLPTVVDEQALSHPTVYVSAGRRGLEIELSPADLVRLCGATVAAIAE